MDQPNINLRLPEHLVSGVSADFAAVSHTEQYFTLDFAVFLGTGYGADGPASPDDGPCSRSSDLTRRTFEQRTRPGGRYTRPSARFLRRCGHRLTLT